MVGGIMAYGVTFYTGNAIAHWRIVSFAERGHSSTALTSRFSPALLLSPLHPEYSSTS
jgi:hypothetical protein